MGFLSDGCRQILFLCGSLGLTVSFFNIFFYFRSRIEKKRTLVVTETSHTLISIRLNEREFHNVFDKYYVALCLFANQYTEDEETSADIVQDSFAKLWQIRDDFFYLHQVKAFLYTAVRNKALNELEHSKVVFEYAQKVIEKKKDSFFHDAVVEEETYRILAEAIDKLPDQMRAIMRLAMEGKKEC